MFMCCNPTCEEVWFHEACVNGCEDALGDWYCSEVCRDNPAYIYCYCHQHKDEEMVSCAAAENCHFHERYHLSCIGFREPPGK